MGEKIKKFQKNLTLIKYVLISLAFCLFIGVVLTLYINQEAPLPEAEEKLFNKKKKKKISKEFSLSSEGNIFEGKDEQETDYKIFSEAAIKDKNEDYLLDLVSAIYFKNDGDLKIKSNYGKLDKDRKYLVLNENAEITFNDIYFSSNQIQLNIEKKDIKTKLPVFVKFKNSTITANSMLTKEQTEIIEFKGRVNSKIILQDF